MRNWPDLGRSSQMIRSRVTRQERAADRHIGNVDLATAVGSTPLVSPLMCASGTAGHGAELSAYFDLATIGGVVVKSLSAEAWAGNPAPRVTHTPAGMINAVGLQGPGVKHWVTEELPGLLGKGAHVVASIWGRSVADYEAAAQMLTPIADQLTALEVNISCPNLEDRNTMFAHSATATTQVMEATAIPGLTRWAKLSPNVADIVPIAAAAAAGGASAVTVANTMIGMVIDTADRKPFLANGRGGLSGPGIRPIAVRAVWDIASELPELPIIGVGGVASGHDVVEFLMAGASAVQVGTATFADPRAVVHIQEELVDWCSANGVEAVTELIRAAH